MTAPPRAHPRTGLVLSLGFALSLGALFSACGGNSQARAKAGAELAAFEGCLMGEPLAPGETLAGRLRGVELAIALQHEAREAPPPPPDAGPYDPSREMYKASQMDMGLTDDADAGPAEAPKAPSVTTWPATCADLSVALKKTLDSPALAGDKSLDALREALPTPARLAMPYALLPEEAADLTAAITAAALPKPASPPAVERAPAPLAAPLPARGLTPLAKGSLDGTVTRARMTDPIATTTLRILTDGPTTRLCTLKGEGGAAYTVARCAPVPSWMDIGPGLPRLAGMDEGAPLALFAKKKVGNVSSYGLVIADPAGQKAVPMRQYTSDAFAFVAKDGAYMVTSSEYSAFVRVGSASKLKTKDIDEPAQDTETSRAMDAVTRGAVAAFGHVFWVDPPPVYSSYDPDRKLWARRVSPSLAAKAESLGQAPADAIDLLDGCKAFGRTALLFSARYGRSINNEKKLRIAVAEGEGSFKGFDVEVGYYIPHLTCGKDAVWVTSADTSTGPHAVVVVQSRCTEKGCEAKRSGPVSTPFGAEFRAATVGSNAMLVWRLRPDRVLSRARGMVFYHVAPIDALAAAKPRPLFENRSRGGFDADRVFLFGRAEAVVLVEKTGKNQPVLYAAKVDPSGAAAPVVVEETSW